MRDERGSFWSARCRFRNGRGERCPNHITSTNGYCDEHEAVLEAADRDLAELLEALQ